MTQFLGPAHSYLSICVAVCALKIPKCLLSDCDYARIPGPSLRRRADTDIPGRALAAAVRLHKDISTTAFCSIACSDSESSHHSLTAVLCFRLQTDLYSGALFVQVCLGWNLYLSTVLMLVVTALYTIAGVHRTPQSHLTLVVFD